MNLLHRKLEDIIISGYTEVDKVAKFSPLMSWVYLEMEVGDYVLLSSNSGNISIEDKVQIECKFDVEEDMFTVSSIIKTGAWYGLITKVDLFYDTYSNLLALGLVILENKNYIFFDAICLDGFEIQEGLDRNQVIQTYRHKYMHSF